MYPFLTGKTLSFTAKAALLLPATALLLAAPLAAPLHAQLAPELPPAQLQSTRSLPVSDNLTEDVESFQNAVQATNDPAILVDGADANARLIKPNIIPGPQPRAFASTAVGTTAANVTFNYTFSTTTSVTVTGTATYTGGATNGDFKDTGTGTCDTNGYPYTYAASATCTMIISFTPSKAGNRAGQVLIYTSPTAYYYGLLSGIGTGPEVTVTPTVPAPTSLETGLSPFASVVDGNGVLYVSDTTTSTVKQYIPSGGVYPSTPTATFSGFGTAQGLAVDGYGSVYVGDGPKGTIWRLVSTNGVVASSTAPVAFASFLVPTTVVPSLVAFDPTGAYLYFTGVYSGSKYVLVCVLSSGSCSLLTTFASPSGLAVDSAGYKYVVDSINKNVTRIATTYNSTSKTVIITGLNAPTGIAADPAGNLYLADQGTGASGTGFITQYLATSGLVPASTPASTNTRSVITGLYTPQGVSLNSNGNIVISDAGNLAVKLIDNSDPFTLTFPNTLSGNTSANQSVTLQNIGNVALTIAAAPAVSAPFALDGSSTCASSLAISAACTEVVKFSPTTNGTQTGTLVTTDNSLNVSGTTQTVNLKGLSADATSSSLALGTSSATVGDPAITLTATVADTTTPAQTPSAGTVTFFDTFNSATTTIGTANVSGGAAAVSYTPATSGTHTITSTFNPDATGKYAASTASGQTLTIAQAPLTGYGYSFTVAQGGSVQIVINIGYPGTVAPTGAVTIMVNGSTANLGTTTCVYKSKHSNCNAIYTAPANMTPGNYPITVTQAADANYSASTTGSGTLQVTSSAAAVKLPTQPVSALKQAKLIK